MNYKNMTTSIATLTLVFFFTACSLSHPDKQGKVQQPVFPEPDKTTFKGGSYVDVTALKKISAGMNKNQIQQLIGHPQFSEGMINVREWDYLFNIQNSYGKNSHCQYKVLFDDNMLAQSFYFKPENCLQQLPQPPAQTCEKKTQGECLSLLKIDRIFVK